MNLDDDLRNALRRQDPGGNFTRRVLAAAESAGEQPRGWRVRLGALAIPRVRWAAAAVCLVVLLGMGIELQRRREFREEGEAAREQVVQALQIASNKLRQIQMKVDRIASQDR